MLSLDAQRMLVKKQNQKIIIQSKVGQKKKNKNHILIHIYGIQKNSTDEPICKAAVEMQTLRTDMWTQWGKKRVGQIKNVHYHMIRQITNGNLLYNAVSSSQVLCENLEGWDGVGDGREVQEAGGMCIWLIHVDVWQIPTQYCKAIILQLKINKFLKPTKHNTRKNSSQITIILPICMVLCNM